MKKQDYTAPQIDIYLMNVAPMMDAYSITGEPTGQGNHNITGAKASLGFDDYESDAEEQFVVK